MGVLIGEDLTCEAGKVLGRPDKRAKTDVSLKGYKAALIAAKGNETATAKAHAKADGIIKSTYRVLLSRGRKGTFVWCQDKGLAQYLRSRLVLAKSKNNGSH